MRVKERRAREVTHMEDKGNDRRRSVKEIHMEFKQAGRNRREQDPGAYIWCHVRGLTQTPADGTEERRRRDIGHRAKSKQVPLRRAFPEKKHYRENTLAKRP